MAHSSAAFLAVFLACLLFFQAANPTSPPPVASIDAARSAVLDQAIQQDFDFCCPCRCGAW